ncbi:protein SGT1 homolog [Solenopsis invicta]|uniref:protein SGT1 homolog n=1 Tax=Solenopsis invicta TaxID=13686 RepID=UPI000595CB32|nr:protein SGT1 homolog [Solenopsis invicta]
MDADETKTEHNEISKPKMKHDWYQTEAYVVVIVLAKNLENVKVQYGECTLSVSAALPSGNEYSLELDLANFIVPEKCSHKVWPSKLEIKLKKQEGIRWTNLEGSPEGLCKVKPIPREILQASGTPPKYPSSCKKSKDWNQVEKEIAKEEASEENDSESAVNALFQKIYGNGSDEVRRAMNKSFLESGGTVLSTNWEEVGQKTVERKPPDGMEWKSWQS